MPRAILKSLFPNRTMFFTGQVNVRDERDRKTIEKTFVITQDYDFYMGQPTDLRPAWKLRLDPNRPSFFIDWKEENGKPKSAMDEKKKTAVKLLAQHERVLCLFGEPNKNLQGEALFSLEFEGMKNTFIADELIEKNKVFNKMMALSAEEKRDCAFYYGLPAQGMKHSELIRALGHYESGKLMSNKVADGQMLGTMEHFLTKYGKEAITDVKLLTEKSIVYNLINKDEKGYWYNEEYIGMTKEDVYAYIKDNENSSKFLKREVGKKENPVEDDMVEEVKKNSAEFKEVVQKPDKKEDERQQELADQPAKDKAQLELSELRDIAKGLGIPHYQVMKKENLLIKIAEKEEAQPA